jgi:hemolysin activation/secretion protein
MLRLSPRPPHSIFKRCFLAAFTLMACSFAFGQGADVTDQPVNVESTGEVIQVEARLYVKEYRVIGAKQLPAAAVEQAVYNYLGPGRTLEDIEGARAALEAAYKEAGYQTVSVSVPEQRGSRGVIVLKVEEAPVGRLRVLGSRYFDIEKIKARAKSLKEGTVPNFNDVQQDIIALNSKSDLRVTPEFKPGALPGTVDVDLVVEDKFPLHGRIELNNRYSANTEPLRLDVSARYENLWQLGHTIGAAFQIAPQNPENATVYSGYYIAPVPGVDWLSVMAQGIRQNSNVSTLGGSAVAGNGYIIGGRLLFELPGKPGFFQNASFGLDYKNFEQDISFGDEVSNAPIEYWPFVASYNAFWLGTGYDVQLDAAVTFHFRGMGSNEVEFDNRRFDATGNFIYLRGTLGHTRDLPLGFQVFGQVQGQATNNSLVDSEQFAAGGLNTVRGYLEGEVLGDSGVIGSLELRTPSLLSWTKRSDMEARIFGFIDGGATYINNPLPEQTDQFSLWSVGVGGSVKLLGWLNGELVMGVPQMSQSPSRAGEPLFTFRIWGEL